MVSYMITILSGLEDTEVKEQLVLSGVGEGGGGSQSPAYPSFLVHNKDNVNAQLYWAQSLVPLQMERVLGEGGYTVEHGC